MAGYYFQELGKLVETGSMRYGCGCIWGVVGVEAFADPFTRSSDERPFGGFSFFSKKHKHRSFPRETAPCRHSFSLISPTATKEGIGTAGIARFPFALLSCPSGNSERPIGEGLFPL